MKTATAALLLALAAACSPTDNIPAAHAQAQQPVAAASTIAYPPVAEGADEGPGYYDYY